MGDSKLLYLSNLNLITNKTILALLKVQKGISLSENDKKNLIDFLGILFLIDNNVKNPYKIIEDEKNIVPLIKLFNDTGVKENILNELITELKEVIEKNHNDELGIIDILKKFSENIKHTMYDEMTSKPEININEYSLATA